MKPTLVLLLVECLMLPAAWAADEAKTTYYVQLICGNDESQPPTQDSKRIGPKLAGKLQPILRWKSYWEINRQQVELERGRKAKVRFNKQREVEIDITVPGKRTVTAYRDGRPIASLTRPSGEAMTVFGGDGDIRSSWFIVVRRDKPSVE